MCFGIRTNIFMFHWVRESLNSQISHLPCGLGKIIPRIDNFYVWSLYQYWRDKTFYCSKTCLHYFKFTITWTFVNEFNDDPMERYPESVFSDEVLSLSKESTSLVWSLSADTILEFLHQIHYLIHMKHTYAWLADTVSSSWQWRRISFLHSN